MNVGGGAKAPPTYRFLPTPGRCVSERVVSLLQESLPWRPGDATVWLRIALRGISFAKQVEVQMGKRGAYDIYLKPVQEMEMCTGLV